MPKLREICRHVRSKNAGPFWVTIDLFFKDEETYARYSESPQLGAQMFASLYDAEASFVKRTPVPALAMVKISYPRAHPQGWMGERDMHSGQQFARLLEIDLEEKG